MPDMLTISGILGRSSFGSPVSEFDPMSGYLSAARKGPVFTAEKCLEIARNLEAKGNKKMAYLWALRAAKTAQNEKKSAIRKQAEEMATRLKDEMAKAAAANVVNGLISGEDCGRFSCMGQLSPKTIALVDNLAPKMLNRPGGVHELFIGIVALHVAKEIAMEQQNKKTISVAARMIRAAKMAKLAKELGLS